MVGDGDDDWKNIANQFKGELHGDSSEHCNCILHIVRALQLLIAVVRSHVQEVEMLCDEPDNIVCQHEHMLTPKMDTTACHLT
jgi:hypothetical protein